VSNYSEQFLKQNPLAVLGVLRDLHKGEVPLRISWSTNQFISKILEATPERLVIDLGSQEYENRAAVRAQSCPIFIFLTTEIDDQTLRGGFKNLADKLICSPTDAQRNFALMQVA